jgi:hypothetical protein
MTTISYNDIAKICKEFVNDPDTIIGMECNWTDYLIWRIKWQPRSAYNKNSIMAALNVSSFEYAFPIHVHNEKYGGEITVYIAVYDDCMEISTKEHLLNNKNEYRHDVHI